MVSKDIELSKLRVKRPAILTAAIFSTAVSLPTFMLSASALLGDGPLLVVVTALSLPNLAILGFTLSSVILTTIITAFSFYLLWKIMEYTINPNEKTRSWAYKALVGVITLALVTLFLVGAAMLILGAAALIVGIPTMLPAVTAVSSFLGLSLIITATASSLKIAALVSIPLGAAIAVSPFITAVGVGLFKKLTKADVDDQKDKTLIK